MAADQFAAMGASDEAGDFELEVGAAEALTGFADSSLWDCHGDLLSFLARQIIGKTEHKAIKIFRQCQKYSELIRCSRCIVFYIKDLSVKRNLAWNR